MAQDVVYLINLRDRFSGKIKNINENLNKFSGRIDRAKKKLKGLMTVQKGFANAARKSFVGFTLPVIGGLGLTLKAWNKQVQAIAQVESGLKATGGVAGRTLSQLRTQATKLQSETLFGDEEILQKVTAQLLTFTNITGNSFDEAQKAVLNVATKLGSDLLPVSIMLGKALNDPVANLGALGRSGIQFSEKQKDLIKVLFQSNRQAQAQAMILKELKKQYGGAAKAAASAGTGPLKQAMNELGDLFEDVGSAFAEMLLPNIPKIRALLKDMRDWVVNNKKLLKQLIKVALFFAGLAPVLGVLSTMISLFAGIAILAKAFGLSMAVAFGWLPAAIFGITAAVVWLEKKFKLISNTIRFLIDSYKKLKGFASSGINKPVGAVLNKDEVAENKRMREIEFARFQNKPSESKLNGEIRVRAEEGSRITSFRTNQPDLAINVAQ